MEVAKRNMVVDAFSHFLSSTKTLRGVSTTIYCNMGERKDNGVTATRLCLRNSIRLIGSVVKEGDW